MAYFMRTSLFLWTDFKPKKILGIWIETQTQMPKKVGSRPNLFWILKNSNPNPNPKSNETQTQNLI